MLGFAISLAVAGAAAPFLLMALRARGLLIPNFRGRLVPLPTGVLVPLAGVLSVGILAALERATGAEVSPWDWAPVVVYVTGVAVLCLVDDAGKLRWDAGTQPRGLRSHARAALGGRVTTGVVKGLGSLALAPVALASPALGPRGTPAWLLSAGILLLAPHVFNLLDLRPGRSIKVLLGLGLLLAVAASGLRALPLLGVFLGPVLVLLVVDLTERGMLGDAGAGAVGAVAGLWLVIALPPAGEALAVLALAATTLYGELRSISSLIDRTRVLRGIDRLGRLGDDRGVSLPR